MTRRFASRFALCIAALVQTACAAESPAGVARCDFGQPLGYTVPASLRDDDFVQRENAAKQAMFESVRSDRPGRMGNGVLQNQRLVADRAIALAVLRKLGPGGKYPRAAREVADSLARIPDVAEAAARLEQITAMAERRIAAGRNRDSGSGNSARLLAAADSVDLMEAVIILSDAAGLESETPVASAAVYARRDSLLTSHSTDTTTYIPRVGQVAGWLDSVRIAIEPIAYEAGLNGWVPTWSIGGGACGAAAGPLVRPNRVQSNCPPCAAAWAAAVTVARSAIWGAALGYFGYEAFAPNKTDEGRYESTIIGLKVGALTGGAAVAWELPTIQVWGSRASGIIEMIVADIFTWFH